MRRKFGIENVTRKKRVKDGKKYAQQESAQQQMSRNSMYQQREELDCEMEDFWRYLMTISKWERKVMQRRGWARERAIRLGRGQRG